MAKKVKRAPKQRAPKQRAPKQRRTPKRHLLRGALRAGRLLSVSEAAAIAGLAEPTIKGHIYSGLLPAKRFGNRAWTIKPADLRRFLDDAPHAGRPRGS